MRYRDKIYTENRFAELDGQFNDAVMCSGCYDILHSGHLYFFEQCRAFGSQLVVSLGSDVLIRKLKGESRPVNPILNRAYLLAGLDIVDAVVTGADAAIEGKIDFYESMPRVKPRVFVLNDDDNSIDQKRAYCLTQGVRLELVSRVLPKELLATSTTKIIGDLTSDE